MCASDFSGSNVAHFQKNILLLYVYTYILSNCLEGTNVTIILYKDTCMPFYISLVIYICMYADGTQLYNTSLIQACAPCVTDLCLLHVNALHTPL